MLIEFAMFDVPIHNGFSGISDSSAHCAEVGLTWLITLLKIRAMSDGFNRFLQDATQFQEGLERYRSTTTYDAGLCRDVYTRLYRLKERFLKEQNYKTLESREEQAIQELFDHPLIVEMLTFRIIGDHTQKDRGKKSPVIRLLSGTPFTLHAETSVASCFIGAMGMVHDDQGRTHYIDHGHYFEQAEKLIRQTVDRCKRE